MKTQVSEKEFAANADLFARARRIEMRLELIDAPTRSTGVHRSTELVGFVEEMLDRSGRQGLEPNPSRDKLDAILVEFMKEEAKRLRSLMTVELSQ